MTDGGLKIGLDYEKPTYSFSDMYGEDLSYFQGFMKDRYEAAGQNFEYLCNSLRNCLQGQEAFVFPVSHDNFRQALADQRTGFGCVLLQESYDELPWRPPRRSGIQWVGSATTTRCLKLTTFLGNRTLAM